ncbi:MAG: hypothetical protein R2882_13865 [Gemmatimonadales bacterium]
MVGAKPVAVFGPPDPGEHPIAERREAKPQAAPIPVEAPVTTIVWGLAIAQFSGWRHRATTLADARPRPIPAAGPAGGRHAWWRRNGRLSGQLTWNPSPDLLLNTLIQYDDESRSVGTNSRLRWTVSPTAEVFLISNHNVRDRLDRREFESNRLPAKLQLAVRR